ncbi:MAG: PLP-dependent aminotransferase family protein [Anaerolineae bacterium]
MADALPSFTFELSQEARTIERSMMRDLLSVAARPGIISFAGGLPAPELFPVKAWGEACSAVLVRDGQGALQYGPPFPPLLEKIGALMGARGYPADPSRILITTGAQQGLHVAARLLMDADSTAVVDRFVFTGVRQAFGGPRRRLRPVAGTPEDGLDVDNFAAALRRPPRPRAAVVIPSFHNPMGVSLTEDKRDAVAELCARHGVAIVEDDPYGLLAFEGPPPLPIAARWPEGAIYIGSFSKTVAPALRLGWLVAPPDLVARLRVLKESVDLETSAFSQRALSHFLAAGHLEAHLANLRRAYRARRDAMLAALAAHFPAGSRWSHPGGGMFLWVELPAGFDSAALLPAAIAAGVAYVPGTAFSASPSPATMRLNFSNSPPDHIAEGVRRLGAVLDSAALAA